MIFVALMITGLVLFFSYRQTPLYTGRARLLVTGFDAVSPPNLETEGEVVSSVPVATLVQEDLQTDVPPDSLLGGLSVEPSSETGSVLNVTYVSADPSLAQAAANSFADSYIDYERQQMRESLNRSRSTLDGRMNRIGSEMKSLSARVERARADGDTGLASALDTRRSILIARLGVLQQQLDALPSESSIESGGGEIIEPARLPSSPSSPNHRNDAVVGLMLGVIAGIGLAFLRDRLDDKFKSRVDVERTLQAPVLATVPKYSFQKQGGRPQLVVASEPRGPASETYRGLRTNVQFLAGERDLKSLILTSAAAGEGKSLTSANLAVALAQTRARIILLSADMRRPTIEQYFGVRRRPGLSDWLSGAQVPLRSLLVSAGVPYLRVIPSGPVPQNPTELLASPRFRELIEILEDNADLVIIDSPPVLPVADSQIMATHVGGVVLIIDASKTHRSSGARAKSEIERVGGQIIGSVLNSFDPESSPYYKDRTYHYYHDYEAEPAPGTSTNGSRSRRKSRTTQ